MFSIVLTVLTTAIVTLVKTIIKWVRILLFSDKKRLAGRLLDRFAPLLLFVGVYFFLGYGVSLLAGFFYYAFNLDYIGSALYQLADSRLPISLLITAIAVVVRWRKNMKKATGELPAEEGAGEPDARKAVNVPGDTSTGDIVRKIESRRLLATLIKAVRIVLFVIMTPQLLLGGLLTAIGLGSMATSLLVIGGICLVAALLLKLIPPKLHTQAAELFKNDIVIPALSRSFDNLRYDRFATFPVEAFRDIRVFEEVDRVQGNDWTEAVYKGIPFRMADATIHQVTRSSYVDEQGNSQQRSVHKQVFAGRVLAFAFEEDFGEEVQVISEDFMNARFSRQNILRGIPDGWESVEMELYEFNRLFNVFAPTAQHAMTLLRPQYLEAIRHVRDVVEYPLLLCFRGHSLFLFIDTEGHDMFDLSGSAGQSAARDLEKLYQHIDMIQEFLDTMYLKGATESAPEKDNALTIEAMGGQAK